MRETGVHEGYSVIDSGEGDATLGWSLQGKLQGWRKVGMRLRSHGSFFLLPMFYKTFLTSPEPDMVPAHTQYQPG